MTGRNDAPTKKAVLVVDNIKQVFGRLSSSSRLVDRFVILVAIFLKVPPKAGIQKIEEYERIYLDNIWPAEMTCRNALLPTTVAGTVGKIKQV